MQRFGLYGILLTHTHIHTNERVCVVDIVEKRVLVWSGVWSCFIMMLLLLFFGNNRCYSLRTIKDEKHTHTHIYFPHTFYHHTLTDRYQHAYCGIKHPNTHTHYRNTHVHVILAHITHIIHTLSNTISSEANHLRKGLALLFIYIIIIIFWTGMCFYMPDLRRLFALDVWSCFYVNIWFLDEDDSNENDV